MKNDTSGQLAYALVTLTELHSDVKNNAPTKTNIINRIRGIQEYLDKTANKIKEECNQ